jgi:hypothetical protein
VRIFGTRYRGPRKRPSVTVGKPVGPDCGTGLWDRTVGPIDGAVCETALSPGYERPAALLTSCFRHAGWWNRCRWWA